MLVLTFVPVCADQFQDGADAYLKKDYEKAHRLIFPLAEKGHAVAQFFFWQPCMIMEKVFRVMQ